MRIPFLTKRTARKGWIVYGLLRFTCVLLPACVTVHGSISNISTIERVALQGAAPHGMHEHGALYLQLEIHQSVISSLPWHCGCCESLSNLASHVFIATLTCAKTRGRGTACGLESHIATRPRRGSLCAFTMKAALQTSCSNLSGGAFHR